MTQILLYETSGLMMISKTVLEIYEWLHLIFLSISFDRTVT